MTLFSKAWKWLDNLFFGRRRRFIIALANISGELKGVNESLRDTIFVLRAILEKTTENMSAATQALIRAQGAFERSDMTFEKIGRLADKMAARESALEELLIAKAKEAAADTKVLEAKLKAAEAETPSEYDKKY